MRTARRKAGKVPVKAAAVIFVFLVPIAAHGQLLKCIGQDGRVEYATECAPGAKEVQTGIRTTREGPSSSGAASPQQKSMAEQEAAFRKRQMEATEARQKEDKKIAEDRNNRANCERAQTYLRSLQEGQQITSIDPKTGEKVYLENYGPEIARARQAADSWCK